MITKAQNHSVCIVGLGFVGLQDVRCRRLILVDVGCWCVACLDVKMLDVGCQDVGCGISLCGML